MARVKKQVSPIEQIEKLKSELLSENTKKQEAENKMSDIQTEISKLESEIFSEFDSKVHKLLFEKNILTSDELNNIYSIIAEMI